MDKLNRHKNICQDLNKLYEAKNKDYGDSFGKSYQEYGLTMACIRLEDKLNRLKSLAKGSEQQIKDESIEDTLKDLANYSIMTIIEFSKEANQN
ncbi:nucleotide modification associated domain-containing protein [Clostridium botulinum]|uniref:nucleotide modification associated domain-containing protein n=1 Tax=Clostridium botulinum TaxID=1491 RepID=UPI0007740FC4|nr:nucleotide modification associated domain-containing protein [Clostridium botulinum]